MKNFDGVDRIYTGSGADSETKTMTERPQGEISLQIKGMYANIEQIETQFEKLTNLLDPILYSPTERDEVDKNPEPKQDTDIGKELANINAKLAAISSHIMGFIPRIAL